VGQRAVPGDVDVAAEQRLDLAVVGREEGEVDDDAVLAEVVAEALPQRDRPGIGGDGADQEKNVLHSVPRRTGPDATT
jgi:hypothetical protein